jgi:hypothetical protein
MNTAASIENKNLCKYVLFLIDAARLQKQATVCTYPMQTACLKYVACVQAPIMLAE